MNTAVFLKYVGKSAVVAWGLVVFDVVFRMGIPSSYYIGLGAGLTIGAYWKALDISNNNV